ncbi:MAG: hypothetical protein A3H69_05335 [Candidatus Sungbacteria bacterium RIFCSPLOWO2_02_FULL_47_9]|uniref:AMP-dependent synthetase/ligase domain-containing protein n=1 Tax=Candidatus Sungbacteria bacterium RIFCSPHIGHO2_01_FULL_47_32 TaxID=1802264 RepID=A0A1G2K6C5_9BACT|nr:MAG: Capsular polysaccharide biosynthesis protein [Parcubacteria group bacterium GW2011_GWA2_47_10]OGZ94992.1 MAG: hypothetical protein A2633_06020 [Candidatus Sungbacteria bacterium RIFCSPHIGHO2_01_FULL_47_32]OGZ99393.1 MAG: hypothetical protein A3D57_00860 [Candidatus Sungbacteria bacterium RIFCSPHIGHO2_02_FULL_46_12]OHA05656.1 MAG: hypothetical protein A3A28_04400 [Candidatus Sungbacteria bacterium RIFCSPLOWO2_01_FULL_47_32]OHA10219.1 MAG: hypothetical protein A3H69_05335 [Candidatus Sung
MYMRNQVHTLYKKAFFFVWKNVQTLPDGIAYHWQNYYLKKIIRHAYRTVPFYEALWFSRGLSPELVSLKDISTLPIIQKRLFLEAGEDRFLSSIYKSSKFSLQKTSGSSGEPLRFIGRQFLASEFYDFAGYRFFVRTGVPLSKVQNTMRIARIRMSPFSHSARLFISVAEFMKDPKAVAVSLLKFCPEVVESYPSILFELSQAAKNDERLSSLRFPLAVSYGETLNSAERQSIQNQFHCAIFDRYGLEELGAIAAECSHHDGFHIYNESFIVEIVDEKGVSVPSGQRGRIIITDLFNFVMPFIRYDTGDVGTIINSRCPCGLPGRRLRLGGREGAFLELPKRKIHHFEIAEVFNDFTERIFQYQIVQKTPSAVEVLIVPSAKFSATDEALLSERLQSLFGAAVFITVKYASEMKHMEGGKIQPILNKMSAPSDIVF